ncbi:uncharacterized protein RJT21DRAFT_118180 [Scheffersomyces amazonensis]|uniref:uncharacterized protein n=1 Tax=Scheffersomyces amazonensis TaxID=1078765 RepID=UPI00315D2CB1
MADPYKELLRATVRNEPTTERRKKRRVNSDKVIEVVSRTGSEDSDSDDFEDVNLDIDDYNASTPDEVNEIKEVNRINEDETLVFTLDSNTNEVVSPKRKVNIVSKEERERRRRVHKCYVLMMIIHGAIRNSWLNDFSITNSIKESVPPLVIALVNQDSSSDNDMVKSRRFLDGIQKLMLIYSQKFRVISQGIIRKDWHELNLRQPNTERVTLARFKRLVLNSRGSRDIGAQGFVLLLRSIGLNARLIFSLQPPDFTSITSNTDNKDISTESENGSGPKTMTPRVAAANNKSRILHQYRSGESTSKKEQSIFKDAPYPVFWAEVWNKYSKKWVSIDPIVNRSIEVVSMRSKSKFEPPLTETRNQLTYVIAYDRLGGVRDVTRRYCKFLNARTSKKRIYSFSDEDMHWYERVLKLTSSVIRRSLSKIDILELKEFYNRDLVEGMPNNLADFKNHPIYVLESQLKQNEVIHPRTEIGTFKSGKGGIQPVFKRSNVHQLKSSRAWYMNGRVLKIGEQPLKTRSKKSRDHEVEDINLYADFQTQLYIPPKIENGRIPRNAYGNIDIYVASMLPEGASLILTQERYPLSMLERAAKIIDIDYAKAVVSFDFTRKGHSAPKAKEGGIVIESKFKEALMLVLESLFDEAREFTIEQTKLRALTNWKFFLTKLRITKRLEKSHGKVIETDDNDIEESDYENDSEEEEDGVIDIYDDRFEDMYDDDDSSDISMDDKVDQEGNNSLRRSDSNIIIEPFENVSERDKSIESMDDEEEGGGFFIESEVEGVQNANVNANENEDVNDYGVIDPNRHVEETDEEDLQELLQDELFSEDENGDLIYRPNRTTNTNTIQDDKTLSNEENFDFDYESD